MFFLSAEHRFIKVQISEDLVIELSNTVYPSGSFAEDLSLVAPLLDPTEPCYILARLDYKNDRDQFKWNILAYVPDRATVKKRMMYASTRSNLKSQLGDDYFVDEIFGSVPADFTQKGYESFIKHKEADVPLTREEDIIKEEREQGIFVGGSGMGGAYAHGIAFPVDDNVYSAMDSFFWRK